MCSTGGCRTRSCSRYSPTRGSAPWSCRTSEPGGSVTATEELQGRYAAAVMMTFGMPPVALARGDGCVVWDVDGNAYLDLVAGIAVSALGHAHPAIVQAVTDQAGRLAHTSNLYLHEPQVQLAERLIALLGVEGRVFFANSGAEANEAAIKLVRRRQGSGRPVFVAAEHSFHGRTMGALSLTGKSSIREPFAPFGLDVRFVPYGDAGALRAAVGPDCAAVFLEPTQGEGGGLPIGACVGIGDCGSALGKGDHGSTFGGNPVACAAALAVLDTIEHDGLLANATEVGNRIAAGVEATGHPLVTGVRGTGLWRAITLAAPAAAAVEAAARQAGFLVNAVQPDAIRLAPPLILTAGQADSFTAELPSILSSASVLVGQVA